MNTFSYIIVVVLALLVAAFTFRLLALYTIRKALNDQLNLAIAETDRLKAEVERLQKTPETIVETATSELKEELAVQGKVDLKLKKALKKAEEANFLKNAFLSNISHEIRTPLNNIVGFASLLEAEISLLEKKELFEYARAISESGDRLLQLLNNIIDMSRIEANDMQLTIRPCNINSVVGTATQLFIFKANEQKLKLNFISNELPAGMADEKSLTNILSAVIGNAIKYTERGFVNISTEFLPKTNEITIRVKDTGVGIDASYLPTLFDPFRNESSGYSRESQGAGLGLPLAKSLIELMNGRLDIQSKKGEGTVVTIFLNAEGVAPESVIDPAADSVVSPPKDDVRKQKARNLQGLEIFIVEDDLMNKLVLFEMTKRMGNVVTAVNGDETMAILESTMAQGKLFDIMLFDINLPPPWDGTKLMQEIRKRWKEYRTIPFVAQTAYAMAGDKEKLLESGFDDYIAKPINQQELNVIIKNQMNKI